MDRDGTGSNGSKDRSAGSRSGLATTSRGDKTCAGGRARLAAEGICTGTAAAGRWGGAAAAAGPRRLPGSGGTRAACEMVHTVEDGGDGRDGSAVAGGATPGHGAAGACGVQVGAGESGTRPNTRRAGGGDDGEKAGDSDSACRWPAADDRETVMVGGADQAPRTRAGQVTQAGHTVVGASRCATRRENASNQTGQVEGFGLRAAPNHGPAAVTMTV